MDIPMKPLAEVTREAIALLNKGLGPADTIRFLSQFTTGWGDYTEERKELFADLTLDDVKAGIERMREAEAPPR